LGRSMFAVFGKSWKELGGNLDTREWVKRGMGQKKQAPRKRREVYDSVARYVESTPIHPSYTDPSRNSTATDIQLLPHFLGRVRLKETLENSSEGKSKRIEPRSGVSHPPIIRCLIAGLLIRNLFRLRLLRTQEACNPVICLPTHNERCAHSRLAIAHNALSADLLDLAVVRLEYVVLALVTLGEREEDERLALRVQLSSWLFDDGELGVNGRERGVTERVGFRDVGGHVLVGLREVGEEGFGETVGESAGNVEGFGAVGVRFEG